MVRESYGGDDSADAHDRTVGDYRVNRYDDSTGTLVWSDAQAAAFTELTGHYAGLLGSPDGKQGLRPDAITDPGEIHDVTAYFAWTAWTAAAERPGHDYSYTNNWPSEPLVDNEPTGHTVTWSVLSLIFLLVGTGALFTAFGRWNFLGWHRRDHRELRFHSPDRVRHPRAARDGLVLPRHGGTVPGPGAAGLRGPALPGRPAELLRHPARPLAALQPGPHLAHPAVDLLGGDLVPGDRPLHRPADLPRLGTPPAGPADPDPARRAGRRGRRQFCWANWRASAAGSATSGRNWATRAGSTWTWGGCGRPC